MKSGCRPPNALQHALGQHALGGVSFHLLLQISHGGDASCECSIRKESFANASKSSRARAPNVLCFLSTSGDEAGLLEREALSSGYPRMPGSRGAVLLHRRNNCYAQSVSVMVVDIPHALA